MPRLDLFVLVTAVVLLVFVVEVVRRRRLSETYALLWIAVGVGGVLLGLARPLIDRFSEALGITYGTSLIFSAALVFLVVVCINLSMHVSRLEDRVETLAQEVAFLRGPRPPEFPEEPTGADAGTR